MGYNSLKGDRCIFKTTNEDALCDVDVYDPTCNMTRFDESTGKPCSTNQTKVSGSCQEVNYDTPPIDCHLLLH